MMVISEQLYIQGFTVLYFESGLVNPWNNANYCSENDKIIGSLQGSSVASDDLKFENKFRIKFANEFSNEN